MKLGFKMVIEVTLLFKDYLLIADSAGDRVIAILLEAKVFWMRITKSSKVVYRLKIHI